jgi:hypothetical protein
VDESRASVDVATFERLPLLGAQAGRGAEQRKRPEGGREITRSRAHPRSAY